MIALVPMVLALCAAGGTSSSAAASSVAAPSSTAAPSSAAALSPSASRDAGSDYRIGAEDVLQISVWNNEPLSRTVPVRPDGKISLPLLNDVAAAGLTPMELREVLLRRLADFVASPEVAVIVTQVRPSSVSVMGAVAHPGRFELRSRITVLDALALAGGFNEFAARSRVVVLRIAEGKARRIPFDYDRLQAREGEQGNFLLEPGDVVLVP
jgi:polysaccharide biosynthesis/export protein